MEDNYIRQGKGGVDSNLFPGLDADTMSALIASEKNWNSDFKGGGIQGVAAAVDFTSKLPIFTTYVTSYVTNIVTSYLAQSTADMLSIDASQIAANAGKMVPKFIKDPGEIMGELLQDAEDIMAQINKANNLNIVNNLNSMVGDQVSKLTDKIGEQMDKVQGTIEDIGKYAYMGPVWIKSKVDLATKKIIESSCKEIGKVRDNVKKNTQEQIDKLAEGMAEKIADDTNTKVQETTKAQLDEANKAKAQALNKAKTAITNAKLQLMALMGG